MKNYVLILLTVFISSCACRKNIDSKTAVGSIEGNWELTFISGPKIAFDGLYPNEKPTINFNINETKVTGKNSCNSFGGNFSLDGLMLDIDEKTLVSTKMFCNGIGEKTFMDALQKVNAYSVTDNGATLNLMTGDLALMRFKKI